MTGAQEVFFHPTVTGFFPGFFPILHEKTSVSILNLPTPIFPGKNINRYKNNSGLHFLVP